MTPADVVGKRIVGLKGNGLLLEDGTVVTAADLQALEPPPPVRPTLAAINRAVSAACNVTAADLRSQSRTSRVTFARFLAWYLARQILRMSYPTIGHEYGRRDHSTVIHGVQRAQRFIDADKAVRELAGRLRVEILADIRDEEPPTPVSSAVCPPA